jgi:hypothetical protein
MTLQEILGARCRSGLPDVFFWPPRGQGFVEAETHSSIRLRLYDSHARNWQWQKAVFGRSASQMAASVGVEITAVPITFAEIVLYSAKGSAITMYNHDDLLIEPIIEILPFHDVTIPSSYFQMD